MLAAQSAIEKALLVTFDVAFAGFGLVVLWQSPAGFKAEFGRIKRYFIHSCLRPCLND